MSTLESIVIAGEAGKLLPSTVDNLKTWKSGSFLPSWADASIDELVVEGAWDELNDRFYKYLEFGTGGMRGRTIGTVLTKHEKGDHYPEGSPAHPAVGSAYLNDFNVVRATIGLYRYCASYLAKEGRKDKPSIVIACDVRHFSRHFSELAASTFVKLGGKAYIFDGPRSTPHLSFAVRQLKTTTGIVVTASHNPPHDNGYKVYFEDGAQVVSPHADLIIREVYKVDLNELPTYLEKDLSDVITVGPDFDAAYLKVLEENVIDRSVFDKAKPKVVFTSIHGTGRVASVPVMQNFGINVVEEEEQAVFDPRFPTVKSPNPENAEALERAIKLAEEVDADIVIATDPDADRMGVAVRNAIGGMTLLTGNMIGSILAEYRVRRMKELGWLPESGTKNAALIKTFVTTPLQAKIAEHHGLKLIDTLTGFKWIGAKLGFYERKLMHILKAEGRSVAYEELSLQERRELLLKHSTYYVFGGEESYGYLASDKVRDKDANAAVLMFCEVAAYLKAKGMTFTKYLDEMYLRYGYYLESLVNIYYEGASGSEKIKRILDDYRENPPQRIGEFMVTKFIDFGAAEIRDEDNHVIPQQNFYVLELDNGYSYAVRGSGTEPKIKFYVFAREDVPEPAALAQVKADTAETIEHLRAAIEEDARARAEGHHGSIHEE